MEHVERLKARLKEITNIGKAAAVLDWDQSTYMPPGGASARAEQLATLRTIAHRTFVDDETLRLLDAAEREVEGARLPPDDADRALLRVARRDYENETRLPSAHVEELARVGALAYDAWTSARANDDFAAFAPWLQKSMDLARKTADYLGYDQHPYDALLRLNEPGMTYERLHALFKELRAGIAPLVRAVVERADRVDDVVLHRSYDEQAQLRFSEDVVRRFGYDFSRGRLDLTVHPFETSFSIDDVRITTRVSPTFLQMNLMGVMHESGHGMYEQGIDHALEGTPLAHGTSGGVHESQSRLWENVVGRSPAFWEYWTPLAQQAFPEQLAGVDVETLWRAFNKAQPSLIRVEADELTYNLHIMARFKLENELLEGRLAVADVPEAWNAAMQDYVGITPPNNREGCLQDVHWSSGYVAGFPSYTIGNVLSVQFYEAAVRSVPSIPDDIARGEFAGLLGWLQQNVYRYGRIYDPDDLVARATGRPMEAGPYLAYLREKFGALYGVPATAAS